MSVGPLIESEEVIDGRSLGTGGGDRLGIDRLENKELHDKVLTRLKDRIDLSSRHMARFHNRWQAAEHQYQAYLNTKTVEELRRRANHKGEAPEFVTLTVPYSYSAVQTVITYLLHTFCGRKPMYQVGSNRADLVQLGSNIETLLQYNADHEKMVRKLYTYFHDGEVYGVQIMRTLWKVEERRKTIYRPGKSSVFGLVNQQPQMQKVQETQITFEGNDILNIDPYRFFPDPRVPMEEVAKKGEFVFWQTSEGIHALKKAEASGLLKYVDKISDLPSGIGPLHQVPGVSARNKLADGQDLQTPNSLASGYNREFIHLMQGTCEIVPSEWGLGESDDYEKWLFTIANWGQIIQAEPLDADHNEHPVIVGEPYSTGYGFGHMGMTDMLGPMQDMMSWMLNSHIYNVRAALNNMLVVNPQMVDMEDFKRPGPGKVIKMKPAAFGQDPKNAVYQLQVQDITRSHVNDLQVINRFADLISSTNDNLRGVQASGGRKTATEVRTSGEAGASRLAAHARLISAQSLVPHGSQMTINLQQNMSQQVYLRILGQEGMEAPLKPIGPEDISGDFYFPVHDGTLPLDRVALLDVWREILMAIISQPGLSQVFDAIGIFEYVAELGGAKNLSTFRVQAATNADIDAAVQQGNVVPLRGAGPAIQSGAGG